MASRRCPDLHAAFDYDVIVDVVAWNAPDYEHTRLTAREILYDLVETAIREHQERETVGHSEGSSSATSPRPEDVA